MKYLISLTALLLPFLCLAAAFSFSDVPTKEGKPYYELDVPVAGAAKNELFHRAQLFLAEYFKKTTPEVQIADKEDGVLATRITLSYRYLNNPDMVNGRCRCLLYVKVTDGNCHISVYDFELYRKATEVRATTPQYKGDPGFAGQAVWDREDEAAVYRHAADKEQRALNMLRHMHECVVKMNEALTKKLKG